METTYRKLAPRQAEALAHRARGLSNAETATAMRCSVANVGNLLSECFFKLHARGATDAVAKAVKLGMIQFCLLLAIAMGITPDTDRFPRPRQPKRPTCQVMRIRREQTA